MHLCHNQEILVTRCSLVNQGLTQVVCIYLREDGYLRGTLYVSRCAREENGSIHSLWFSVPGSTISVMWSPMFNVAVRRAHPTCVRWEQG